MRPVQEFIEFCDQVHANDDHECWSMTWLDTLREGRSLILRLAVDTGLDDGPSQIWEVGLAHHTRGFPWSTSSSPTGPLRRPRPACGTTKSRSASSISRGPPAEHEEVLWRLYERHRAVASALDSVRALPQSGGPRVPAVGGMRGPGRRARSPAARVCRRSRRKRSRALFSLSAPAGPPVGRRTTLLGR